jgi:hypothetical protein
MSLQIIDCEQGSVDWYAARLGVPTASRFATVMAKGKQGGESLTRKEYLLKLAGEIVTGEPMDNYVSPHMERGKVLEDEARDLYAFQKNEGCQSRLAAWQGWRVRDQDGARPHSN